MDYDIDGTPISIVRHTDVRADVECLIYPVHISHTRRIDQLLKSDPFFNGVELMYDGANGRVSTVICRFDCWAVSEVVEKLPYVEEKVNEVFDAFLAESQGYHSIKA